MPKKFLVLLLSFILIAGLPAVQVRAYDMGKVGEYQKISTSRWHTAAIKQDGSLWMWGSNTGGELGIGTVSDVVSTPVKVMDDVVSVSCGEYYTAAIRSDGSLWMWGSNQYGQLGNGGIGNAYSADGKCMIQTTPVKILDNVIAVCCGGDSSSGSNTAAILDDGSLWVWGRGLRSFGFFSGQTNTTPVKVMDNAAAISCTYNMAAAIKTDGSLWVWGGLSVWDDFYDSYMFKYCDDPVKISDDAVALSCGADYVAFIKSDLSLWIWGGNSWGQYGNGTVGKNGVPACSTAFPAAPVPGMDNVISVSCGSSHVLTIKSDGSLWGWGGNYFSMLGNNRAGNALLNANTSYEEPIQTLPIKIMDDVSVARGAFGHSVAVKKDGSIWGWGENAAGQLGFSGGNRTVVFRGAVGSADGSTQFENSRGVQTIPRKMENFAMW